MVFSYTTWKHYSFNTKKQLKHPNFRTVFFGQLHIVPMISNKRLNCRYQKPNNFIRLPNEMQKWPGRYFKANMNTIGHCFS